jgi:hypothetical protein
MTGEPVEAYTSVVPFGGGRLLLRILRQRPFAAYGSPSVRVDATLTFQDQSGAATVLHSLEDILRIAENGRVDLSHEVSRSPMEFARLIADYEQIGDVLLPIWRHEHYSTTYNIDLPGNQPRVEGRVFRFLTSDLCLTNTLPAIRDVTVNLDNLSISISEIRTLD